MKSVVTAVCVASVLTVVTPFLVCADVPSSPPENAPDWKKMYEEQKERNDELERRISLLEDHATQDVYVAKETVPESTLKFLKQTEIDGYVSGSYFYNFNRPEDHLNLGRGFDSRADEFMANKLVVRIGHPVDYSAFDWLAGYSAKVIFGLSAVIMDQRLLLQ